MKSTLWKLAALAGVMGAGFLVVYQAKLNIAANRSGDASAEKEDSFNSLDDPPEADDGNDVVTGIEDESHDAGDLLPSQDDEPKLASSAEPTPAWESVGADTSSFDPFADGSEPERSTAESREPTASPPPAEEHRNPQRSRFAELVASIADTETPDKSRAGSASTRNEPQFAGFDDHNASSSETSSAPALEPADSVNPFARNDEPPKAGARFASETPHARAESQPTLRSADTDDVDPFADVADAADETAPVLPSESDGVPLTRLDPGAEGPSLIAPPFDAANDQPPPDSRDTKLADAPDLADRSAEEPILPGADDPFAVAQTSSAQPGANDKAGEPNPFLVLPGGSEPSPIPSPHTSPEGRANSRLDDTPVEPRFDPAPSFSELPAPSRQPSKDVVSADGSVEMTVRPRTSASANPFAAESSPQPAETPAERGVDPFGGSRSTESPPEKDTSEPGPNPFSFGATSEPQRATLEPELPAARPAPDLTLPSFPAEPRLQPAPARLPGHAISGPVEVRPAPTAIAPRAHPQPQLGPEDFVGVGTVEDDSPLGTQQAQVTIDKQAPPDAVIGNPLIYSIHVRNIGGTVAENVVVKDVTPKGSRLVGTAPQAELDEVSNTLVWRLGKMSSGELRTIKIKVIPTHPGPIGSVATVSFEAAVAARTVITAPDLKLAIQGPEELSVGEKATYRFTLTNDGSADANGVFIRNIIPDGLEHPRGSDLEYEVGVLRRGQSVNVDLTLLAVEPGTYQNRAVLGAEGDVSVEASQGVSVLASRLTVRREGPANRFVGRSARFTNTITNESNAALPEVTVVETVPAGVQFEGASENGVFDRQRGTVTWRLGPIEPGANRQVQISFIPAQAAEYASTVKAFDSKGTSAEVTSHLEVAGFSSLKVDVAHDGAPVPIGEEVALRLTIKNRGTAAANQVKTLVEIPPEMRFVNAQGPVKYRLVGNNLIEFETLNTLEIDGEEQFDIVLAATQKGDARVRVELQAAELSRPLNQEELVVIHANQE